MNENFIDYYLILNINKKASLSEIKKAYKKQAMIFHPDRATGDKEKFQLLQQAIKILSDKILRYNYDIEHQEYYLNKNTKQKKEKQIQHIYYVCDISFFTSILGGQITFYIPPLNSHFSAYIEPGTEQDSFIKIHNNKNIHYYIKININNDKIYKREGINLFATIKLEYFNAILGCTMIFPHWEGDVTVKIPALTQNNDKIVLSNKGVKKSIYSGDLILTIEVILPTKISNKEKNALLLIRDMHS